VQRLATLHTIDMAINSGTNLRITLDILLRHMTAQLGVDAADVLLLRPGLNRLEFTAGCGFRGKGINLSYSRLGEGYAGEAALKHRMVSIPDLSKVKPAFARDNLIISEGFAAYYAVPLIAKGQVKGVLEIFHRTPFTSNPEWLDYLETLGGQAALAIDSTELYEGLQRSNIELLLAYETTIEGWSRAMDLRDEETEGHTRRVTELTIELARKLGVGDEEILHLKRGGLLHDIGKMGVPDAILLKPEQLTEAELVIMRKHPQYAYDMLSSIEYLRPSLDIPYCHHEWWDGSGYPRGLKGKQIPLAARIFAVADVWDALTSNRPYRKAWPKTRAIKYIRTLSGKQFDPQVIDAFLEIIEK
jgi:putative nucleotidyltransferase with HDIG domain